MVKGGLRPRSSDGSLEHLIKPKWKTGQTKTIRVPVALVDQILEIAYELDNGANDLKQVNTTLSQEKTESEEKLIHAIKLLESAITPKSKGGTYAANNATGIRKKVEAALELLKSN